MVPEKKPEASKEEPSVEAEKPSYASYFTIRCALGIGEASTTDILVTAGSLSFGAQGFSVVANEGKTWQRFQYRDLRATQLHDDGVVLSLNSSNFAAPNEVKIAVRGGRLGLGAKTRARALHDLLSRVQAGLTSTEIDYFQRTLA